MSPPIKLFKISDGTDPDERAAFKDLVIRLSEEQLDYFMPIYNAYVNAGEYSLSEIQDAFNLKFGNASRWELKKECLVDPPQTPRHAPGRPQLRRVRRHSMPHHLRKEYEKTPQVDPATHKPALRKLKRFLDTSISIDLHHAFGKEGKVEAKGQADWTLSCKTSPKKGTILVGVTVKESGQFGAGRVQLIAYLAILHEKRKRAEKTNTDTQGFFSDGRYYSFIAIAKDSAILESKLYDTHTEAELKVVFSFIVNMLETSLESMPPASPSKLTPEPAETDSHNRRKEVWEKVFTTPGDALRRHAPLGDGEIAKELELGMARN
ncbi:MAG: hypothetical protein M1829_005017 [Trizodia sp. TS-e1964]|nr:MAG: hypothetical protein M1829_005017 [Trizodia sp. TS-e1964]